MIFCGLKKSGQVHVYLRLVWLGISFNQGHLYPEFGLSGSKYTVSQINVFMGQKLKMYL